MKIMKSDKQRCIGFFYLKVLSSGAERKCQVWDGSAGIIVWDGANWYPYSAFEACDLVAS
jgi:hypothetical protein